METKDLQIVNVKRVIERLEIKIEILEKDLKDYKNKNLALPHTYDFMVDTLTGKIHAYNESLELLKQNIYI